MIIVIINKNYIDFGVYNFERRCLACALPFGDSFAVGASYGF